MCFSWRVATAAQASIAMAAYSVQKSINSFFGSAAMGISVSTLMVAGILFGERDKEGMTVLAKVSLKYVTIASLVISVILFTGAPFWVAIFLNQPNVTGMAINIVRIFSLSMPLFGIVRVFKKYLQGIQRIKYSNCVGICEIFIFSITGAYLLGKAVGIYGVFFSFFTAELATVFLIVHI